MKGIASSSKLILLLICLLVVTESFGFMKGPCRKKRWSKCHPMKFSIVKRADVPMPAELGSEITLHDWRELVKTRTGSVTRRALLKVLKDMKADIVAEIDLGPSEKGSDGV